jgi:hypothetical protein
VVYRFATYHRQGRYGLALFGSVSNVDACNVCIPLGVMQLHPYDGHHDALALPLHYLNHIYYPLRTPNTMSNLITKLLAFAFDDKQYLVKLM